MSSVRDAYDRHAGVYDELLGPSEIRSDVWEIADRFFGEGMRLLDAGCGSGDDAIHFARRGVQVTAVDISPAMIARLKLKCGETVRCEVAAMETYSPEGICFDGVFSNFSSLNYVSDLRWLRRIPLTPGAYLVLTTLGRFYPLESAILVLKGHPWLALRRFRRSCEGEVAGIHFRVYYHSVRAIQNALGSRFELKLVAGLRALMPIPDLDHLRRLKVCRLLRPIDRWWCTHLPTAVLSDQFISVWRAAQS